MAEAELPEQQDAKLREPVKGRKRKRILIVFGFAIAALVLGVLVLPKPVARYIIADQLDRMGIVHKGVDTLDIDLWNQEVKVGPLEFRKANGEPGQIGQFSLKLRLANLLRRRAVVEHVVIDGVDLKILRARNGAISINGIDIQAYTANQGDRAAPAPDDDPWQASLEKLQLRDSRVVLDQEGAGKLTVRIGRLDLNGFRTWEPEKPGKFDLDATVNGVGFKWRGESRPFADKITLSIDANVNDVEIAKIERFSGSLGLEKSGGTLSSRFKHEVFLHADGRIDWVTAGTMDIGDADIAVAGQGGVGSESTRVNVTARISVQADNRVEVTSGIGIVMRKIRAVAPDGQTITSEGITIDLPDLAGKVQPDGSVEATVTPRMVLEGARLDGPASVRIKGLTVGATKFDVKRSSQALSLSAAGLASLDRTSVAMPSNGERPAVDITIGSLQAPVDMLSFSLTDDAPRWQAAFSMVIKDLAAKLAKGDAADVRLGSLSADNVRVDQTMTATIKALLLSGLNAKLSEKILPPAAPKKADAAVKNMESAAPSKGQAGIAIGRLALVDSGNIHFTDVSVTPGVDFKTSLDRFEVSNLDTGNPTQRSNLNFKAKINEFTDLELSGWATPFTPKPDFDLKLKVKGLELTRFSPYVVKAVGMHMESGQLNLDAAMTGKQAALDAKLDVNILNLELGELLPEDAKKLAGKVGMPIQTAIGLLQDSDKAINLKIPVKGTVSEPEVDISDAIQKAVGGALTSLFPPTAIASMLISASKGGATFAPIPFDVGTAKLNNAGETMVQNIAQLLAKRPKLSLRVCGRSTFGDVEHYKALVLDQQQIGQRRQKSTGSQSQPPNMPASGKDAAGSPVAKPAVEEILKSAKNPMAKLALDRTRAVRNSLLMQNKALKGRVSECRSAYNPMDKKPPRAKVTL